MKNAEIDSHELLTAEQRQMCKVFRNASKSRREPFSMFDFAKIALRACARDYSNAGDDGDDERASVRDLQHAAVLYVYEALKACDIAIIKEWPEFDEMIRSLEYLRRDLPL